MPNLAQHHSNEYTKMLLEGDSGSGKTGALTSLIPDFHLRILDMDNGLETLKLFAQKAGYDLRRVEYKTLRDSFKASPLGPIIAGQPKAFVDALKMLDRWAFDDVDLGSPAEWGPDVILVVDSLTFLSDSAFNWAEGLNPNAKDKRQTYGLAQDAIEKVLALLTSPNFKTNVIVISHVKYIDNPDGTRKGYPTAVGSALSPIIPRYFNSVALCQTSATGKRTIQTQATAMIDLKNPKPFSMAKEYPIDIGLAEFFRVLRHKETPNETQATHQPSTQVSNLKRPTRKMA